MDKPRLIFINLIYFLIFLLPYSKSYAQGLFSCHGNVEVILNVSPTSITAATIGLNPEPSGPYTIDPNTVDCNDAGTSIDYTVTENGMFICFGILHVNDKCAVCDNSTIVVTIQDELNKIAAQYVCDDLEMKRGLQIVEQQGIPAMQRITDLSPLQEIIKIGDLSTDALGLGIQNTSSLISLTGLEQLETIEGSLVISNNQALRDLSALSINSLETITGDLIISDNPLLENLDGLQSLTSVGGNIVITNNSNLTNCTDLLELLKVKSSDNITIAGNASGCESLELLIPTVPTLGQWCVIILFLLFLIIGVVSINRFELSKAKV